MARLPVPGSDDGAWGDLLNDYLSVSHTSAGTLKSDAVSGANLQDNSVTDDKLSATGGSDGQILTKNSAIGGGIEWTTAAGAPDATTSSKGIVQLAGDLAGTAAAPTVPELANKVNLSTIDAKGDLLAGTAADTVSRLTAGTDGQLLTADSTQTTGLKWSTPGAGLAEYYPISAYGFVAVADTIAAFTGSSTFETSVTRIFVPAGKAITAVGVLINSVGGLSGGGLNGYAVYDDAGTLLQTTPSDNNLFTSVGWRFKNLNAVIPAQSADRFVRVHTNVQGYSALPSSMYAVVAPSSGEAFNGGYNMPNHRRSVYENALSSFPASFNPATYGTPYEYLPLIALG